MIFIKLISVFWFSISSMFSIGSKESSNYIESRDLVSKSILQRDDYYIMGASERNSIESLYSIFNYANTVNNYLSGWVNCDEQTRYINLVEIGGNSNIDNLVYISNITSSTMPTIFNARRLRFYSKVYNEQNFRRWFYFIGFGNDGNNEEYSINFNIFTDLTNTTPVAERTAQLYNVSFLHSLDWVNAGSPIEETDYAFTFSKNGTLAQMYDSYIYSNDDADFNSGYARGYGVGEKTGYNTGFEEGYTQGSAGSPEITSIFTGILDVGLLPVNVFLSIFNFELFGVNVSGLITGMLTIGMIMILLRFIFGGKNNDK